MVPIFRKPLFLMVIMLFSGFHQTFAEEKSDTIDRLNELSQTASECAAFYEIGSYCAGDKMDQEATTRTRNSIKTMNYAMFLSGKAAGLSQEALLARNSLTLKTLMGRMSNNCINFSILLNSYADLCRSMGETLK